MVGTAGAAARVRRRPRGRPGGRPRGRVSRYAVALVAALLLAGCGGHDQPTAQPGTSGPDQPSATATSSASVAPAPPEKPLPRYGMPRPAQCFRAGAAQLRSTVATARPVDCSRQHTTVVAWAGVVSKPITGQTPAARRLQVAQRMCLPAFRRAVGGNASDRAMSLLAWTMFTPSAEQLARGARWVRCDVFAQSGSQLVPLPEKLPLLGSGIPEVLRVCQGTDGADISCGRPHTYRVEKVFQVSSYPGPAYQRQARDRCDQLMGPGGYWQPPSRQGWDSGDHFVRCLSKQG
jgi:hypothetical protein